MKNHVSIASRGRSISTSQSLGGLVRVAGAWRRYVWSSMYHGISCAVQYGTHQNTYSVVDVGKILYGRVFSEPKLLTCVNYARQGSINQLLTTVPAISAI